jgi:hypothetical protein
MRLASSAARSRSSAASRRPSRVHRIAASCRPATSLLQLLPHLSHRPAAGHITPPSKRTSVTPSPPAPSHTAWLPPPCSYSDMVEATMSFAFSGETARVRTTSHGSVLGAQEQRPRASADRARGRLRPGGSAPERRERGIHAVSAASGRGRATCRPVPGALRDHRTGGRGPAHRSRHCELTQPEDHPGDWYPIAGRRAPATAQGRAAETSRLTSRPGRTAGVRPV